MRSLGLVVGKAAGEVVPAGGVLGEKLVVDAACEERFVEQGVEQYPELAPRFIFATGGARNATEERFLDTCGQPVIEKPFTRDDILEALGRVGAG